MGPTFRASLNALHTWAGVILGGLLFAIFWMGTLTVFDREIDLWMQPGTRLASGQPVSVDAVAGELKPLIGGASQWFMRFPTDREPAVRVGYRGTGGPFVQRHLDPATLRLLPETGTLAGTGFIFPFHYSLNIRTWSLGYWLVGLAGMAMLTLCVSGVVIHRKIFTEFFTFRVDKKPRRLMLDLHNVSGVLGLPFHFIISLSGLIIFFSIYFPSTTELAYGGDPRSFNREVFGIYGRPKANLPAAASVSLDGLVREASRRWEGERPFFVRVWHPGDANSYVEMRRPYHGAVTMNLDLVYFDAVTGAVLHTFTAAPVLTVQRFVSGLHFIQFRHWTLRWVYFGLGLSGCLLIATGYLFWLESRRTRHRQLGLPGVRIVEGLAVGSVTGIVVATLAFFVANRLLPPDATFLGEERAALEVSIFYIVWVATFAYAWLRPGKAWLEQSRTIAALAMAAVILNWVTTGHHLGKSLAAAHLRAVAGMDLLLLATAAIAVWAARRLARKARRRAATTPGPSIAL